MVRWGILGCGGIARRMAAVIPEARDARLVAAAARDKERAAAFAARHTYSFEVIIAYSPLLLKS